MPNLIDIAKPLISVPVKGRTERVDRDRTTSAAEPAPASDATPSKRSESPTAKLTGSCS